jgi:tetratricopeptide (TPR) repeat protein
MRIRNVLPFLLVLIFTAGMALATDLASASEWFRQGNTAYEKGNFQEAAEDYQKAEDLGVANATLYYNHGNALFRLNQLGPSILFYERAHKLEPLDEDINFNLRYAQSHVEDKVPEPESNLLTRVLWRLHASYSIRSGLWAAFALFTLAFAFAISALMLLSFLRWLSVVGAVVAVLALLALSPSLLYKIHQQETEEYAIVMQPVVEMFSGPGENYQVLAKVHEGTKFEIVEEHGDWLSVKLANGKGGYVRANQLGRV